jgi:hypothetical protein
MPRKNHRGAPRTKNAAEKSPRCTTHKKSHRKITAVHHAQKKPQKIHRGVPHKNAAIFFFLIFFFTAVNHVKCEEVAKR